MNSNEIEKKLSKLHALHFGAKTEGERVSAIKAKKRILKKIAVQDPLKSNIEYKFSLKNKKNVSLFIDILNRYDINQYRLPKRAETTVIAKVPGVFVDSIIWPEYLETSKRFTI